MTTIAFVDDDELVLRSLKRLARSAGRDLDVLTFNRPTEAVKVLHDGGIDILVSDLNMPDMYGGELLRTVQREAPDIVRVALTASASPSSAMNLVGTAHQFFSKPVDPKEFAEVLRRAVRLRELLDDERLRKIVARRNELPILSSVHSQLLAALEEGNANRLAQLVESDVALAARALHVTSSPFFGRRHAPRSVRDAVVALGTQALRALVLEQAIVSVSHNALEVFDVDRLQSVAVRTGFLSRNVVDFGPTVDEALTGGLLHGVGQLVLASRAPRRYRRVLAAAEQQGRFLPNVERDQFGATSAEVGAYLLGIWGLAQPIVDSVRHQHAPASIDETTVGIQTAVHVAARLALDPEAPLVDDDSASPGIDRELLDRTGGQARLEGWRQLARRLAAAHPIAA